jgi:hypothetical protein
MQEPCKTRLFAREKPGIETVRQGAPDPRNAFRVKCGGGYHVIRKTIPRS